MDEITWKRNNSITCIRTQSWWWYADETSPNQHSPIRLQSINNLLLIFVFKNWSNHTWYLTVFPGTGQTSCRYWNVRNFQMTQLEFFENINSRRHFQLKGLFQLCQLGSIARQVRANLKSESCKRKNWKLKGSRFTNGLLKDCWHHSGAIFIRHFQFGI